MAHHVFRRCLLADVVPPVPPVAGGDYRLVVEPISLFILDHVAGIELSTSVAGLNVMAQLLIEPIPPGVDTGLGYYRQNVAGNIAFVYDVPPVEIHGSRRASGATI